MISQRTTVLTVACLTCALFFGVVVWNWGYGGEEGRALTSSVAPAGAPIVSQPTLEKDGRAAPAAEPAQRTEVSATIADPEGAPDPKDALAKAHKDLALHCRAGLDGVLFVNEVLDSVLAFASLPVDAHPDLEFGDNDAIAYKLLGAPEGTTAHVLVGLQPYYEDGRTFRYLQMQIQEDCGTSEYLLDSQREGPFISLSIGYDETDKYAPTRFGLTVQRPVDIAGSRDAGVDAYHGRYTHGARFWVDLLKDPYNPTTTTFGIVDGNPASTAAFDGIRPLAGNVHLDQERLATLLRQLQSHLSTIKGE